MGRWRLSMIFKDRRGKYTRGLVALVLLALAGALASCDSNPDTGPTPPAVRGGNPTPTPAPARINGLPVLYVMTWYRQYPVAAVSIKGKGPDLKTPADLKGHTVGVPFPSGSTYVGLLALLNAGGLSLNNIQLKNIGFTQVEN